MSNMTKERYEAMLADGHKLERILRWDDKGRAILVERRGDSPALAMDADGYEYAVDCGIRRTPTGGAEMWTNGKLTHVASNAQAPTWQPVAGVGETAYQTIEAHDVSKRHGAHVLRAIRVWVDGVREWRGNPKARANPQWLLLSGPTGCGKTATARFVQREFAGFGVVAEFCPWREVVTRGRAARAEGKDPANLIGSIIIIDDIGADNGSAFAAELLFATVDHAEQTGQVLVFTTNVEPERLLGAYKSEGGAALANAERAVSRIGRRSLVMAMGGGK